MKKTRMFKPVPLTVALGFVSMGVMVPAVSYATSLGGVHSADGRFGVSVNYQTSTRKVEQDGRGVLFSEKETYTEFSETMTESFEYFVSDMRAKEEQSDLFVQMSMAVTPKIAVYGNAGVTQSRLKDHKVNKQGVTFSVAGSGFHYSETMSFTEDASDLGTGKSKQGLVAGIGAQFAILDSRTSGFGLSLDVLYQHRDSKADWFLMDMDGTGTEGIRISKVRSNELSASLIADARFGQLRPYGGLRYSQYESKYRTEFVSENADFNGSRGDFTMENRNAFGGIMGLEYSVMPGMRLIGEMSVGDRDSFNVGMRFAF